MKRTRIRRCVIRQLRRGEAVPEGAPRRYKSGHGYIRLRWKVGTESYVETYEHRVVDGIVTDAEHVHHRNGDKTDNSHENLAPLTADEHNRLHAEQRVGTRYERAKGNGKYAPYPGKAAKERAERAQRRRDERRARAEEMRRLYLDEHLTTVEIGQRFGLHSSGVSRELRSIGIRLRPGGKRSPSATGPTSGVRQVVTARAQLCCERCGSSVKWTPSHVHHRKPRGMGGSSDPEINSPSNLMLLCPSCHVAVESSRQISFEQGWLVRRDHDPAEQPVWLAGRGWSYLNPDGSTVPAERSAA